MTSTPGRARAALAPAVVLGPGRSPAAATSEAERGEGGVFTRAVPDSGDELPATLTAGQLRG